MDSSNPLDWIAVVADGLAPFAWPSVVLIAIIVVGGRLGSWADEIELSWKGVNAKVRTGNSRAKMLLKSAEDDEDTGQTVAPPTDAAESAGDLPYVTDELAENDPSQRRKTDISYYSRVVIDRLQGSARNTDTTSARLSAEIVGNTWAEVKQAMRVFNYMVTGVGTRGPLKTSERLLRDLDLPPDLLSDLSDARRLAQDVTDRVVAVDGTGASQYIDAAVLLVSRLRDHVLSRVIDVGS